MSDFIPWLIFAAIALLFDVVVGRAKRKMQHGPLDWEQIQREHDDAREQEEAQEIYVGGLPLPPESRASSVKSLEDIVRAAQLQMEEERQRELKSLESHETFDDLEKNKDWQVGGQVGLVPSMIVPAMTDTLRPEISYSGVQDRLEVDRHRPTVGSKAQRGSISTEKKALSKEGASSSAWRYRLQLTPATARQAIVLMEVIGPPKAMQP